MSKGIVIKSTGSWYSVESEEAKVYNCRIKGKLRLKGVRTTNPISVGDIVSFDIEQTNSNTEILQGIITEICPRRNYIIRKSTNLSKESHIIASNVDNVFLIATLDFPPTPNEFIDRFLVTCEVYKVPVIIVLNKMDLFDAPEFKEVIDNFHALYNSAGYKIIHTSAVTSEGITEIQELMKDKTSLFSGNSGVGKSSIIKVVTNIEIKTGDVSESHHKGKHTTTFSEMFKLDDGGYLIDTPGIKGFGLIDINKDELARYFPDMFKYISECKFYNCTHTHEPGCAVKRAVESGDIFAERYNSYLKMLEQENDSRYR